MYIMNVNILWIRYLFKIINDSMRRIIYQPLRMCRYSYARLMQYFSNNLNTECRVYMLVWEMHHRQFKKYVIQWGHFKTKMLSFLCGDFYEKKDVFMVILFS